MNLTELPREELSSRLYARSGLPLRLGPFVLRLQVTLKELHPSLALLYADHELAPDQAICDFLIRLSPCHTLPPWKKLARLDIDDCSRFDPFGRGLSLPMLEWGINWCTFSKPHQYFILHSAVLEKNGRGLLLPGLPGAGKSTLCAALALRGWRLLSDELAMMRPGSTALIPLPRPIGLKNASIEAIRRFEPSAAMGPAIRGTRKGTVAHLKPPKESLLRADERATPRWIIFPAFQKGSTVLFEPSSKAQTFLWLAKDAFNFNVLGEKAFDSLSELLDICDCYELSYGDLNEAVAFLDRMSEGDA